MNVRNVPHIFNYNKIEDCKLPEGRVSIPFGFQLVNPNANVVPIALPGGFLLQGDYFLLDMSSINAGVKSLSGIKSIEFDATFSPSILVGHPFANSSLTILVQDSQQVFSFIPSGVPDETANNNFGGGIIHAVIPIISNAPSKIWFVLDGTDLGATDSDVIVSGNANNFELAPYTYQSSF